MLNYPTSEVSTFNFQEDYQVRTLLQKDKSIWFIAKDVCEVLKFSETAAATRHLEEDETMSVKLAGMNMKSTIISESGLYALIFKSRKPQAKKFRKWVTSEVLPQIRKTGIYSTESTESQSQISQHAVISFMQAATDTFWEIDKAIAKYSSMLDSLKKAKNETAIIIRSINKAFPKSIEGFNPMETIDTSVPLEVEMR